MSAAAGAAVAAGGAAVGFGTFGYNRENYMWDQENRWERFTSAREYANQQAEQFRADLRSMAALTGQKTKVWCIMSSLTMALCVALYCAGRLGLHGPSPPAWIMGLWLTNNAAAFAFMALAMFLAMHAGFRAQAASTQLLTRVTRVPVPTLKELDNARMFASQFEQQDYGDMFRVPLVTNNGAPRTDDATYTSDGVGAQPAVPGEKREGRKACSSWIQDEFETDREAKCDREGNELNPLPADLAPEHFRIFEQVQKEYYEHDIYARVAVFYGFLHYVQSLAYYGLGHINIELRAFWTAYGCCFVLAVLQVLLLNFDIIPQKTSSKIPLIGHYAQYLGPIAILPAAIGMSMDFQVQYNPTSIGVCWVLIFVAYILQCLYACRLLEIVLPDEAFAAMEERLGGNVLPQGWTQIPSAFFHVWYFVSPPTKLQPGQHDLVREVKEGGNGAYYEVGGEDMPAATETRQPDPIKGDIFGASKHIRPGWLVARIAGVMPPAWIFLIGGCVVDVLVGEQGLVTAPHWSRPPMTRLSKEPHELGTPLGGPRPAGAIPNTPEMMAWHEEKRHAGSFHIRRLQAAPRSSAFPDALKNLVAAISSADKEAAVQADAQRISWPGFFEPKMMACGNDHVAALTPRGYGAVAHVSPDRESTAESFKLSGLGDLPALLGVSMGLQDGEGLLAVSRAGHLAACPGPRPKAGGVWACSASLPKLPLAEGSTLTAASAAWLLGSGGSARRLHAAMVVDSAPDLVGLFIHEAGAWLPLGEVRIPGEAKRAALSFVDGSDLLVVTADELIRRNLLNGKVVASQRNAWVGPREGEQMEWQAACGFGESVAHLHLHKAHASRAWRPELISAKLS